ncbi:helix-turn-helix transcriptional regulator [Bacteroidia bacterium]|nr:helix-turn-helix transcriptional regulator [Bacteroidia bacterium]
MSGIVKIALIEPSLILRSGVLAVLHRLNSIQMEVFEIAETEQIKSVLSWQKPDVLILNPGVLNALSLTQIKKESGNPQIKCIALQSSLADAASLQMFDEVISLYDTAGEMASKLTKLIVEPEVTTPSEVLTVREKEIVVCVVRGMSNKQIAEKLHVSTHTVVSHRRNIAAKLQIHTTSGLTIYAIVNKLVDLNGRNDLL